MRFKILAKIRLSGILRKVDFAVKVRSWEKNAKKAA